MGNLQITRVKNNKELENAVEDTQARGYSLQNRSDRTANLIQRNNGKAIWHIVLLLTTVWWTFGIGNVAYWAYSYFVNKNEVQIKMEDKEVK